MRSSSSVGLGGPGDQEFIPMADPWDGYISTYVHGWLILMGSM